MLRSATRSLLRAAARPQQHLAHRETCSLPQRMLASSSSSASSASSDTQSGQESSLAGQRSSTASSSSSSPAIKPLAFDLAQLHNFPSLLHFADPVLDAGETVHRPATASNPFPSSYTIYNDPQHYDPTPPSAASLVLSSGGAGGGGEEVNSETYLASVTPLSAAEVRALHRYTITVNRVVHMTTKGKDASMYALVITGNGQGLVGYGEGKDINASKANRKAFHAAVKSMDFVERYEERSVWGEVEGKWGATRVVMRPRPSGFGLRVPHVLHAICRACGIHDLSASIYGSSNPLNVTKAALQVLWGGAAPTGLGDGIQGPMRRRDKGAGMRTVRDIELARGRRLREIAIRR